MVFRAYRSRAKKNAEGEPTRGTERNHGVSSRSISAPGHWLVNSLLRFGLFLHGREFLLLVRRQDGSHLRLGILLDFLHLALLLVVAQGSVALHRLHLLDLVLHNRLELLLLII